VRNIRELAASKTRFGPIRPPNNPAPNVNAADPSSVAVIRTPISLGD
jgi:hypothetical protein